MKPILTHKIYASWRLFLLVPLLSACVPLFYDYEYIHLDENTMQVIDSGKATAHISSLFKHSNMPIRYVLKTKSYNLYASIPLNYYKKMRFTVESLNNDKIYIIGSELKPHGGFVDKSNVVPRYDPPLKENELVYFWREIQKKPLDTSNLILTIKVLSKQGELLGEHKIPFSIKKNGFHIEYDGI